MAAAFYIIKRFLYSFKWKFTMMLWWFTSKSTGVSVSNKYFSIGIVTYIDRYEKFFKPLIRCIVSIFPDTQIVIAINGYHNKELQAAYLENTKVFLRAFKNIKIIEFNEPQSLSKLWNLLILNSDCERTIIFNDDVKLSPTFRMNLHESTILNENIALMNRSWSHFLISKKIVKEIGWFDERFPAVGNEDEDYECRLTLSGIIIKSFKIKSLLNATFKTKNFSWKNTAVINKKYVRENQLFFNSKWDVSDTPLLDYVWVEILGKYIKLKKGMETPNFYKPSVEETPQIIL